MYNKITKTNKSVKQQSLFISSLYIEFTSNFAPFCIGSSKKKKKNLHHSVFPKIRSLFDTEWAHSVNSVTREMCV